MKTYIRAKVAVYYGDIGILTRRYSDDFRKLGGVAGISQLYAMTETEEGADYRYMISSDNSNPNIDYNTVITVCGPNRKKVQRRFRQFSTTLGIRTQAPPNGLEKRWEAIAKAVGNQIS